jgi:hypothetical protein
VLKKEESEKIGVKVEYRIGGRMGVWPKVNIPSSFRTREISLFYSNFL